MEYSMSEADVADAIQLYLLTKGIEVSDIRKVTSPNYYGGKDIYYKISGCECEKPFLITEVEFKDNLKKAYKSGYKSGLKEGLKELNKND